MSRVTSLNMSTMEVLIALSEGNPGGLNVLLQIVKDDGKIDPDSVLGSMGTLLFLDTLEIYGARIWMLYKDVCGQNLPKTMGLLRAAQLSIISKETLDFAIDNRGKGIDLEAVLGQVKERLPKFNLEAA